MFLKYRCFWKVCGHRPFSKKKWRGFISGYQSTSMEMFDLKMMLLLQSCYIKHRHVEIKVSLYILTAAPLQESSRNGRHTQLNNSSRLTCSMEVRAGLFFATICCLNVRSSLFEAFINPWLYKIEFRYNKDNTNLPIKIQRI